MRTKKICSLAIFLICIFITACSKQSRVSNDDKKNENTIANAIASSTSTSSTPTSTSSSETVNTNPVTQKAGDSSDKKNAMEAYRAVLYNEKELIGLEKNKRYLLKDYHLESDIPYEVNTFTVTDIGSDNVPDVLLRFKDIYGCAALRYVNGEVYAYKYLIEHPQGIKKDGTFTDYYVHSRKIKKMSFTSSGGLLEELAIVKISSNSSYMINNASVTKEAFDTFEKDQNKKTNAISYFYNLETVAKNLLASY